MVPPYIAFVPGRTVALNKKSVLRIEKIKLDVTGKDLAIHRFGLKRKF